MANFSNSDRTVVDGETLLIGTVGDDLFSLSSTFLLGGTSAGAIDGGAGDDTLQANSLNLRGTTLSSIEETQVSRNAYVDAAQAAGLGSVVLASGTYSSGEYEYANLYLYSGDGVTATVNAALLDGQYLQVGDQNTSGDAVTVDFSGGSFAGNAHIRYTGSNADETVTGGAGDDILSGGYGDDNLDGGAGNDSIYDTSGANTLSGGAGDDTITGYGEGTVINGGADDDYIAPASTLQNGAIDGGAGDDTLYLSSRSIQGTTLVGIEETQVWRYAYVDAAQAAGLGSVVLASDTYSSGGYEYAYLYLTNGDGETATVSAALLDGQYLQVGDQNTSGDAVRVDFSGSSFAGNSHIRYTGSNADETVTGGAGDDILSGGYGDDNLDGGAGNDSIYDTSGANTLSGGAGDDTITGYGTGTVIDGGADDDYIAPDLSLQNGAIDGGAGDDTLYLSGIRLQGTTFAGIEETQVWRYAYVDAAQAASLGSVVLASGTYSGGGYEYANLYLTNGDGETATLRAALLDGQYLQVDDQNSFGDAIRVDFSGGSFAGNAHIRYRGSYADETVIGGAGDDILTGGGGEDNFDGGAGDDSISGASGANTLSGGAGDDTITGYGEGTVIDGGADDDYIAPASTLQNGAIDGGAGDDTLYLSSGRLQGTTFVGIEETQVWRYAYVDAAQAAGLGSVMLASGTYSSGEYEYAYLYLTNGDGQTATLRAALLDGQYLVVDDQNSFGDAVRVDFSASTGAGNAYIQYQGTSGVAEYVIAGAIAGNYSVGRSSNVNDQDTISYETSSLGVTIDLAASAVSGGDGANDTILGFDNAVGSSGGDVLIGNAGDNAFDGGDGADVVVFSGNRADYDIVTVGDVTTVRDLNTADGDDGSDTVVNVEVLRFADGDVQLVAYASVLDISGSPEVAEGDSGTTVLSFTVTRSGDDGAAASADWAVSSSMAEGVDFIGGVLPSGTVSFAPGQTSATIHVDVAGDTADELDEVFTVTLSNPEGATLATATASGTILDDDNGAPVAVDDTGAVGEDTLVAVDVLANDSDPESDRLSITGVTQPSTGYAYVQEGRVYFQARGYFDHLAEGETTTETVTYTVSDGEWSDTATLEITITGANDAPRLGSYTYPETYEDGAPVSIDLSTIAVDPDSDDDGSSLSFALGDAPSAGSVSLVGTLLTFDPGEDLQLLREDHGTWVSVPVLLTDSHGLTEEASVSIWVNGRNDAPVITSSASATVDEGTTSAIDVDASDVDRYESLVYSIEGGADAALFTIDQSTGMVSFLAAPVFSAPADSDGDNIYELQVGVSDPHVTVTQDFAVSVTGATVVRASVSQSAAEEGDSGTRSVTFTLTRAGDLTQAVTATLAATGTASASSDFSGAIPSSLTIAAGAASASFTVEIIGDLSDESDETVGFTVTSLSREDHVLGSGYEGATHTILNDDANVAPTAVADSASTDEDTSVRIDVLANDGDGNGDSLTISSLTQPANGTVWLDAGQIRYLPDADWSGEDSFGYTISDGRGGTDTASVTVTVAPVNDDPEAGNNRYSLDEDGSLSVTAAAGVLADDRDAEGDALSARLVSGPDHGSLTLNADGSFVYVPEANFNGTDTYLYEASDGKGGSAQALVTLEVASLNDDPEAVDDSYGTDFATVLSVSAVAGVLANDTDPDDEEALSASLVSGVGHGTLVFNGDGSFRYTPNAGFSGTDRFTYRASDAAGDSDVASVSILVGANSPPVALDDSASTSEDTAVRIDVLANDSDANGGTLSISGYSQGSHGSVSLSEGRLLYTPQANWSGVDTLRYTVSDGQGGSDSATVRVSVSAVNDAPSFVAGTGGLIRVAENTTTVAEFSAIDPEGDALSFSIGGVDAALFDINAETGALSFRAAPDFEAPADADGDNDHELVVSVSDGDLSTSVEVTVRVSDVEETVFFVGTSGRDHLLGSTADETFLLRGGNDMVVTGGGADVIVFTDTPGYRDVVTITDFDSTMDQLDLGGLSVSQSASRAGLTLLILDNNDTIALLGVDEWLS